MHGLHLKFEIKEVDNMDSLIFVFQQKFWAQLFKAP